MTERIYTAEQLSGLAEHGVEAQKIRALFLAYGGEYDFCRFFRQGRSYLAALDGSFVLAEQPGADYEELAQFLEMHGFTDLFCSQEAGEALSPLVNADFTRVNLMERQGGGQGVLPEDKSPSEVWNIIGSRFEIPFEPWYLDMSHRVRHRVTRCFSDGKAALAVQHELKGEALISQVSVLREYERCGFARGLLEQVCAALSGRAQVICEDSLRGFYERCGFTIAEHKYVAENRRTR